MAWPPQIPPGSKAMREFWKVLVSRITETTPIEGIGIFVEDAPNGKSINAGVKSGSGGGTAATHPWYPEIITDDYGDQIVSVGEGRIFPSLNDPTALDFEAMGFTFPAYTGAIADGDKVFVQIDYDASDLPGGLLAAGTVCYLDKENGDWGDAGLELQEWETDPASDDYDMQTIARIPVCEVYLDNSLATPILVLRQLARNDWWMAATSFNGRLADWPSSI